MKPFFFFERYCNVTVWTSSLALQVDAGRLDSWSFYAKWRLNIRMIFSQNFAVLNLEKNESTVKGKITHLTKFGSYGGQDELQLPAHQFICALWHLRPLTTEHSVYPALLHHSSASQGCQRGIERERERNTLATSAETFFECKLMSASSEGCSPLAIEKYQCGNIPEDKGITIGRSSQVYVSMLTRLTSSALTSHWFRGHLLKKCITMLYYS